MPASPHVAARHNQLYLPGTPPPTPRTPQSVQRLETSPPPAPGLPPAEQSPLPPAQPAGTTLRQAARQVHALSDRSPSGFAPVQGYTLSPLEASFRHGFWAARRARVAAALYAAGVSGRRSENFANCGANAWVLQNRRDGQLKTTASYCHDRFCQACQQARAARIVAGLTRRVPAAKCLHVVLTIASSDRPLSEQLDRLYRSASKLRARKWWRTKVTGGSQTLELTRNQVTGQWHPHLHLLVHAQWLAQAELADQWQSVTGDSRIVHVSLVAHTTAAIREVTKYLAKPIHRSIDFDEPSLVELIKGLKGRRLIATYGSWRSDPLLTEPEDDPADDWHVVMSLHTLAARAAARDEWALQALAHLTSQAPGRQRTAPPPYLPAG